MADPTENHGYDKPEVGGSSGTWGSELNTIIDSLDVDVALTDTFGNRPADPPEGTWFRATDRKILYQYEGGSWEAIAGVATSANPLPEQYVSELTTESLVDADDDSAWETLRELGFESGDVVPIDAYRHDKRAYSFTNTSYSDNGGILDLIVDYDNYPNEDLYFKLIARLNNDTNGETTSVKIETADPDVECSITGSGSVNDESGWVNQGTQSGLATLKTFTKVSGGAGTVFSLTFVIGVKL